MKCLHFQTTLVFFSRRHTHSLLPFCFLLERGELWPERRFLRRAQFQAAGPPDVRFVTLATWYEFNLSDYAHVCCLRMSTRGTEDEDVAEQPAIFFCFNLLLLSCGETGEPLGVHICFGAA